jgi:hypothetical protein
MGRRLLGLGVMLIVTTVALWVAEVADWIPASTDDRWSSLTLKAGLIALAAGVVFRILAPLAGTAGKGRCTVCGRSTERGHVYCLDHLQATVNATRDEARRRTPPRPPTFRSSGR